VRAEPLGREPTAAEAALLNPDLSRLGDDLGADVIRAELGYATREPLLRYFLPSDDAPRTRGKW
jgi:hypothetical protein